MPTGVASIPLPGDDSALRRALATWALDHTRLALPDEPLATDEWSSLLRDVRTHRLMGFLSGAVVHGDLPVTDEQIEDLDTEVERWMAHVLKVERLTQEVLAILEQADVDHRVLKGVSLCHTYYDNPADRVFADIDILVPSSGLSPAVEGISATLEATRALPEVRPGFDERFGKEVLLKVGGFEIDVHRTLASGPFGLKVDLDELFSMTAVEYPIGTTTVNTLPPTPMMLAVCFNTALGDVPPRLASLRDVIQVHDRGQVDAGELLDLAQRWRAEIVVQRAVLLSWRWLERTDRPAILEWAEQYRPPVSQRLMMQSYLGRGRNYMRHAAAVSAIPRMGDRVDYIKAIAAPQDDYLAARGWSASSHLRRSMRKLVRG